MIPGHIERRIKRYMIVDTKLTSHILEPDEGEEFWGIPTDWYGENTPEHIEIRKINKIYKTINPQRIFEIEFYTSEDELQ